MRGAAEEKIAANASDLDTRIKDWRKEGLRVIGEAVSGWNPDTARLNHSMALARLDWRHRFRVIADTFGEMPAVRRMTSTMMVPRNRLTG